MNARLWTYSLVAISSSCLVGCTQPLNDRSTLGGSSMPPSFRVLSTPSSSDLSPDLLGSTPSPRSAWTPRQYISPMDSTVHGALVMRIAVQDIHNPPREYGRYPTVNDALSIQAISWSNDLRITIAELGRTVFGSPYALGYLLINGQLFEPTLSPNQVWKRTTETSWSSGYPSVAQSNEVIKLPDTDTQDTPDEH